MNIFYLRIVSSFRQELTLLLEKRPGLKYKMERRFFEALETLRDGLVPGDKKIKLSICVGQYSVVISIMTESLSNITTSSRMHENR